MLKMHKQLGSKANMVLKIDLEKAFDRLKWPFIYNTLRHFNFPPKTSKLIMNCITTSKIYVLVNDSRSQFFYPSGGIRQGDPLSPCIFILCMEILSTQIIHNVDIRIWTPIRMEKNQCFLSHLFYADDLTLMCNIDKIFPTTILTCLKNICSLSGQKIN